MKKAYLILAGISVFLLYACSSNVTEQVEVLVQPGELVTITAYSDNAAQTKTSLVDDGNGGKAVEWKTGNSISLFFNQGTNGGDKFTTAANGPIAEFSGKISAVSGSLSGVGGKAYFWGVYPYNALNSCDGTSITTTLPASQKAYAGDVADNLLVTVGRSENLSIYFKNTCAVIGFKLSQENIKKVIFSGRANEAVAGEFSVSFDSGNNLVVEPTANAVTSISVTPAESSTFTPGTTYYFATLPDTFSDGYTLTFIREDGYAAQFIRESSFTFAISNYYTMTKKDSGLTFSSTAPGAIVPVSSVMMNQSSAEINANETLQLFAMVLPANATEKTITWTSSNPTIASVDENGLVTGLNDGTVTIEAAADDKSATCEVTVHANITFADNNIKAALVANFDDNNDGEISFAEAESVSSIAGVFLEKNYTSFDEFRYFTSVTSIPSSCFSNWTSLSSIIIPEGLKSIGSSAFSGCSSLSYISIPATVNNIGASAFSGCSSLISVVIPNGLSAILANVFSGCSNLKSITIPSSVTSIGGSAFKDCTNLRSIALPTGTTSIGNNAFSGCSKLSVITIPQNVEAIGSYAFSNCSALQEIVLPEATTTIGEYAFSGCTSLTSAEIKGNITAVDKALFQNCSTLVSVLLPESIIYIQENAFYACSSLTSVGIPQNTERIEGYAFYGCSSLTSICITEKVGRLGSGAFRSCNSLTQIICLPMNPPYLETGIGTGNDPFYNTNNCPILVPYHSLESYTLGGSTWQGLYGSRIQALPEQL